MNEKTKKNFKRWIWVLIVIIQITILCICFSSVKSQNASQETDKNPPIKLETEKAKYIATVSQISQWSEEKETKKYYLTFGIRDDQIMDTIEKNNILYLTDEKTYIPVEEAIQNSHLDIMNASNSNGPQTTYVKLETETMVDSSRLFVLLKNDKNAEKAGMFTLSKSFNLGEFVNAPNKKNNAGVVRVYDKDTDEKHFFEILEKYEEESSIYWKVNVKNLSNSKDFQNNIQKNLSFLDKDKNPIEDLAEYSQYELFCNKDENSDCYLIGCRRLDEEKINIKNENISGLAYLYDMTLKFEF